MEIFDEGLIISFDLHEEVIDLVIEQEIEYKDVEEDVDLPRKIITWASSEQ